MVQQTRRDFGRNLALLLGGTAAGACMPKKPQWAWFRGGKLDVKVSHPDRGYISALRAIKAFRFEHGGHPARKAMMDRFLSGKPEEAVEFLPTLRSIFVVAAKQPCAYGCMVYAHTPEYLSEIRTFLETPGLNEIMLIGCHAVQMNCAGKTSAIEMELWPYGKLEPSEKRLCGEMELGAIRVLNKALAREELRGSECEGAAALSANLPPRLMWADFRANPRNCLFAIMGRATGHTGVPPSDLLEQFASLGDIFSMPKLDKDALSLLALFVQQAAQDDPLRPYPGRPIRAIRDGLKNGAFSKEMLEFYSEVYNNDRSISNSDTSASRRLILAALSNPSFKAGYFHPMVSLIRSYTSYDGKYGMDTPLIQFLGTLVSHPSFSPRMADEYGPMYEGGGGGLVGRQSPESFREALEAYAGNPHSDISNPRKLSLLLESIYARGERTEIPLETRRDEPQRYRYESALDGFAKAVAHQNAGEEEVSAILSIIPRARGEALNTAFSSFARMLDSESYSRQMLSEFEGAAIIEGSRK